MPASRGVNWEQLDADKDQSAKQPLTENNFLPLATQESIAAQIPGRPRRGKDLFRPSDLFSMPRNTNPFDDENINPTANAAVATTSASVPSRKPWIPAGLGGSGKHGATIDIPLEDPKKKERELLSWEKDLKRREQDIKRREDAMNRAGVTVEVRNWPEFYPIIHHDIANEIPIHAQKLQYAAFASWLGLIACLVWNFFAVLAESIHSEDIVVFLLAVIYAISGCPLSYILWYRPLYRAMRTDSVVTFGQFFVCYSIHVGFCVIAAIAPPIIFRGKTLTGILVAIDVLAGDMFTGVLYFIGFVFFTLESLISIWVLERVYMYFRGHR